MRFTIKLKLALAFGLTILLSIALTTVALNGLAAVHTGAEASYEAARSLLWAVSAVLVVATFAAAFWATIAVTGGLKKIATAAETLAKGDLDGVVEYDIDDEIKAVTDSLKTVSANLKDTTDVVTRMSVGDLSRDPKLVSDKDSLSKALQLVLAAERRISAGTQKAANGDLSYTPNLRSDNDKLAASRRLLITWPSATCRRTRTCYPMPTSSARHFPLSSTPSGKSRRTCSWSRPVIFRSNRNRARIWTSS